MAYDVKKLWTQKDNELTADGWGATEYYSVTGTLTEMADDKNLLLASGLPRLKQSHPTNRILQLYSLAAGPGLVERVITARYQWFPNGFPSQQTADPTTKKPVITWGPLDETVSRSYDIFGNLMTNSAGDLVEQLPQIAKGYRTLNIVRYERGWNPEIADRFEETINSVDMFAGGRRFPRGTMLCRRILPAESYEADANIIPVQYSFDVKTRFSGQSLTGLGGGTTGQLAGAIKAVNAEPFRFWFPDRGVRSMYDGGGKVPGDLYLKIPVTSSTSTPELQREDEPVLLRKGIPINSSKYYVTSQRKTPAANSQIKKNVKVISVGDVDLIGYQIYESANFLELGL